MTYQEFKQAVIRHAEAMGIAEYEIYYQAEESTLLTRSSVLGIRMSDAGSSR